MRVRDNGWGIAEEERPRIFDPSLPPPSSKHGSSPLPAPTGLEMFVVRGLVEMHGGLISVDSQPDVFTEFTVLLPFKQRPRDTESNGTPIL